MFSIDLNREKSSDPVFYLSVSVYGNGIEATDAEVEVLRRPPKVSFIYPDELKDVLPPVEQKKLELEILNRIAEYIIETPDGSRF
jgi:hypothetical protein